MAFLKIIRPINLIVLLLTQCVIKYGFLDRLEIPLAMGTADFILIVTATLCIAAGGNVINDICDVKIDTINAPKDVIVGKKISEKKAFNFYMILNVIGVGSGFLLANRLGHPALAAIFIGISILLYSYATYLNALLLIGNFTVSALVASSLIILIIFDIYPTITNNSTPLQGAAASSILWFALCAFYLNLVREIVKDIEDVNGDKNGDRSTLAIVLGRQRTTNIAFVMGVTALCLLLWFTYTYLYSFNYVDFYFVFLIGAPLLYFCIRAWNAKTAKDHHAMSTTLKIIMVTGVCSIVFFAEILTLYI